MSNSRRPDRRMPPGALEAAIASKRAWLERMELVDELREQIARMEWLRDHLDSLPANRCDCTGRCSGEEPGLAWCEWCAWFVRRCEAHGGRDELDALKVEHDVQAHGAGR